MSIAPLVTIAIPAYNAQRFLPKGLDSVRNQTYQNIEILIADDGSSDSTASICEDLAKIDSRIRVLHLSHQGVGPTRNSLIENAHGDFFYFCDIDDHIDPHLVEENVNSLEKNNLDVPFFELTVENPTIGLSDSVLLKSHIMISNDQFKEFYCNELSVSPYGCGHMPTKFFRMSFLRPLYINGIKFEHIPMHEDKLFNLAIFKHITHTCSLPLTLYHYVIYPKGNTTTSYRPNDINYSVKLYQQRIKLYSEWIMDNNKVLNAYREQLLIDISYSIMKYEFYSQSNMTFSQNLKTISHTLNLPEVRDCVSHCRIQLCDYPNSIFSKLTDHSFYRNRPLLFLLSRNARDIYRKLKK